MQRRHFRLASTVFARLAPKHSRSLAYLDGLIIAALNVSRRVATLATYNFILDWVSLAAQGLL
jgi:ABC-type glucose/galactose transport system permease subunit